MRQLTITMLLLLLVVALLGYQAAASLPRDIVHWQYQGAPSNLSALNWHERPRFWHRHHLEAAVLQHSFGQFRNLFAKLDRGERILAAGMGSSILKDFSGFYGSPQDLQAAGFMRDGVFNNAKFMGDTAQQRRAELGKESGWLPGWMNYVMQVINATWPKPPGAAGHLYANLGLSGMRVDRYGEDYLRKYVPQNVDLIVLENIDATAEGPGLEILLMAIQRHCNGIMPAVLVWNSGMLFSAGQGCWGEGLRCSPAHCAAAKFLLTDGNYVLSRREDVVFRLAQWYGFSALSWRSLTLGMERDDKLLNLTECQFVASLHMDQSHPSLLGEVLIADAIMNLLVHAQNHLANHPAHGPPGQPPTRLYVDPRIRNPDHQVQSHTTTFFSATDQNAATQLHVLDTSSSWSFTMYQLHGNTTKYKPGWVGLKVGARLVVRMPPELQLWRTHLHMATLRVSYLSSYKFMGAVLVRCVSPSACACDPTILSGAIDGAGDWKGKHQVSITDEKGVRLYLPRHWAWDGPANTKSLVTTDGPGASPPPGGVPPLAGPLPGEAECDVEFTVMESRLAGSGSDVHKFKITRLALDYDLSIWQ